MSSPQKNKDTFVHTGFISKINSDSVIVSLEQSIHCESCHAKGTCGVSESSAKEIEVPNSSDVFKINERVSVILKKATRLKSSLLGLCISFYFNVFNPNSRFEFFKRVASWIIIAFYLNSILLDALWFKN